MANIASNLVSSAQRYPDSIAVKLDDQEVSYAGLDEQAARIAGWLGGLGVGPGDRIAMSLPNLPIVVGLYYGALRAGAVVVPMNPLFKPREVSYYLSDSGAKVVVGMFPDTEEGAKDAGVPYVGAAELPAMLADAEPVTEVVDRDDDDTAVILYTSGTTGKPKGAELRHSNLQTNQEVCARTLMDLKHGDVFMGCLPLFHVFAMTCVMNTTIGVGGTLTLIPRFDPAAVLDMMVRDQVTAFAGVPTMYAAMLHTARAMDTPPALDTLRIAVCGGSAMPVEVMKAFEQQFDCIILEGYGLSETSPVASFNHPDKERKPGSIGTPIEGVEMDILDPTGAPVTDGGVGEIVIRGEGIMRGYFNKPEATAEAIREGGWFWSGDLGRRDEDGYYFIVDRSKDMIIRGGLNVYPREIEELLYEHPAIREAAVVGVPHDTLGEDVAAYVALHPGQQASAEEIIAFAKERVAPYKYPRTIHFIEELPKGATGKILKRELPR